MAHMFDMQEETTQIKPMNCFKNSVKKQSKLWKRNREHFYQQLEWESAGFTWDLIKDQNTMSVNMAITSVTPSKSCSIHCNTLRIILKNKNKKSMKDNEWFYCSCRQIEFISHSIWSSSVSSSFCRILKKNFYSPRFTDGRQRTWLDVEQPLLGHLVLSVELIFPKIVFVL